MVSQLVQAVPLGILTILIVYQVVSIVPSLNGIIEWIHRSQSRA